MIYREFSPSRAQRTLIRNYWTFRVFQRKGETYPVQHDTLPDNCLSVVYIRQPYFRGVRILGPHTAKLRKAVYPESVYLGARFHPWVVFPIGIAAKRDVLNNTSGVTEEVSSCFASLEARRDVLTTSATEALQAGIADLTDRFDFAENQMVKFICLELENNRSISEIVRSIPASVRVIQKKFKEVTGVTMRQYANTLRLRRLWTDLLDNPDRKKELVYQYDYYDQAHFINAFKKKMGRSHNDFADYLKSIKIILNKD